MAYTDLIITEYIEGSSNNKAIEIYNGTGGAVNLAAAGYSLQMFFNGNPVSTLTINLTGSVAAGDVYVIANSGANAAILALADQTNGSGWFNGDDAITLRKGATVIDSIGQVGFDPGSEWGAGLVSTADNTLRRLTNVLVGDSNAADVFDPTMQWEGFAQDNIADLGSYTPAPSAPQLSVVATDASASEAGSGTGTFRISRTGDTSAALTLAYTLGGSADASDYTPLLGGTVDIPAGSSFVDITLTPVDDILVEGDETLTLTLQPVVGFELGSSTAMITLADNDEPPTPIHLIQGNGGASPLVGRTVTVEAVVVGDFQGADGLQGFYVQEQDADADLDPSTSEGLFIFQGNSGVAVQLGDLVLVTGRVIEFGTAGRSLTELGQLSAVTVLPSDRALPSAAVLQFPLADGTSLEALEGMRVTVPTTLTVTDTFTLGRFGEVLLASDGPGNQPGTDARLDQYTQFNAPSVDGLAEYLAEIAPRQLLLDDGNGSQNRDPVLFGRGGEPLSAANTLRGGDTVSGLTGVIDQRFAEYRLQPTETVDFQAVNARTPDPGVDGRIKVASFNVLNFFNGDVDADNDGFPTSRGADSPTELLRQRDKLVAAIRDLDADVVGLIEIENDGDRPAPAIAELVSALNHAMGDGTYAYIDLGGKLGTDEITVGFIYKPGTVRPQGDFATLVDASLPRPSLAQTFVDRATGALFTPVINHFKSKGSPDGATGGDIDIGDGAGAWNAQRTTAAGLLADWLATDPTGQGDADAIVLGDLNAYAMEDPLAALRAGADGVAGSADDLTDLVDGRSYSFSFDGQWGSLDHALGSASLMRQVVDAGKWHINADEPTVLDYNLEFKNDAQDALFYEADPYRSSDHDPVVVGLNPGLVLQGTGAADRLTGSIGNDVLRGGQGHDTLTGLAGDDLYVFDSLRDAHDTITDFEPGHDALDISALLAAAGYSGSDPAGDGWLRVSVPGSANPNRGAAPGHPQTVVFFDSNGAAPGGQQLIVTLTGVVVTDAALLLDMGG